jgi:hypothetical protein
MSVLTHQNGGTHIAWNVVWMAPSICNLLTDWPTELVKTPIDMLVYCAIRHFVEGLPMEIDQRIPIEVFEKFPLVEEAVASAKVSHLVRFLRSATSPIFGDTSIFEIN